MRKPGQPKGSHPPQVSGNVEQVKCLLWQLWTQYVGYTESQTVFKTTWYSGEDVIVSTRPGTYWVCLIFVIYFWGTCNDYQKGGKKRKKAISRRNKWKIKMFRRKLEVHKACMCLVKVVLHLRSKSERDKRMLLLTLVNNALHEDLRKDDSNLHRKWMCEGKQESWPRLRVWWE